MGISNNHISSGTSCATQFESQDDFWKIEILSLAYFFRKHLPAISEWQKHLFFFLFCYERLPWILLALYTLYILEFNFLFLNLEVCHVFCCICVYFYTFFVLHILDNKAYIMIIWHYEIKLLLILWFLFQANSTIITCLNF